MKKITFSVLLLSALVLLVCTSCNKTLEKVNMKSEIYSDAELNEACQLAIDNREQYDGVKVYRIEYQGDKKSDAQKNDTIVIPTEYQNSLDRCMLFTVYYKVSIGQKDGWPSGEWQFDFIIGSRKGENLRIINFGN